MKLWLLRPAVSDGPWRRKYDCNFGFVIRARTEEQARVLASSHPGDEGTDCWLNAELSSCEPLYGRGKQEMIIQDFNAG